MSHILSYNEFLNEAKNAGIEYEDTICNAIVELVKAEADGNVDEVLSKNKNLKNLYDAEIKGKVKNVRKIDINDPESIVYHKGDKRTNRNSKNEIFDSSLDVKSIDDKRAFKESAEIIADVILNFDEKVYVSVKKKKHQNSSVSVRRALQESDIIKLDPHGKESNMVILDESMSRSNYDKAFENIMKVMCVKADKIKEALDGKNSEPLNKSFWDNSEENLEKAKLTMLRLCGSGYWYVDENESKFIEINTDKIKDLDITFKGVRVSPSGRTMTSTFGIGSTSFSLIFRTSESSDRHPSRLFYTVEDLDTLLKSL